MAIKRFLTSVADVYGYDENNQLIFTAKTLLDSADGRYPGFLCSNVFDGLHRSLAPLMLATGHFLAQQYVHEAITTDSSGCTRVSYGYCAGAVLSL